MPRFKIIDLNASHRDAFSDQFGTTEFVARELASVQSIRSGEVDNLDEMLGKYAR